MRLIEADAVIHVQTYNEMTEDWCVKETTVERALNYWADEGCPSIVDAVPVIRCKDCKAFNGLNCVRNNMIAVRTDDYCSRAEREEG